MTPRPARLLLLAAAAVLAGCGSSSSRAAPTATATQPETSRTAQQIYGDALTEMARQQSVHIVGHQVDSTGAAADVDIVVTARSARATLRGPAGTVYLVVTPDAVDVSAAPDGP
jgi:ABC-type glycerol-3-phosphate transport system substrate-binding protein